MTSGHVAYTPIPYVIYIYMPRNLTPHELCVNLVSSLNIAEKVTSRDLNKHLFSFHAKVSKTLMFRDLTSRDLYIDSCTPLNLARYSMSGGLTLRHLY